MVTIFKNAARSVLFYVALAGGALLLLKWRAERQAAARRLRGYAKGRRRFDRSLREPVPETVSDDELRRAVDAISN